MFRYLTLLAACAAVLATAASAAAAQGADVMARTAVADSPGVSTKVSPIAETPALSQAVGPTVESGVAGVRTRTHAVVLAAPVAQERMGRNPAMIIVGGTALLVGAIVGDDAGTIIMVGGAVIGLIGLWNILR